MSERKQRERTGKKGKEKYTDGECCTGMIFSLQEMGCRRDYNFREERDKVQTLLDRKK
jgi:hypothetical protein